MSHIVLRNGHVIDPANRVNGIADVRVADGMVEAVGRDLPERPGDHAIDVAGLYVTPGIIDMHVHVAHTHARSELSLHPLVNTLSSGVTTVVDTGTTGWRDFAQFRSDVIDNRRWKLRVLAYVNIVGSGMGGEWEHDACEMHPQLAADTARMHEDVVVGIKTAHYWAKRRFDAEHAPWTAVDRAIEAAELCGMPVMYDFFPTLPERTYEELILRKARAGDIHTHVFAQQFPVLDDDGKVARHMHDARERGVIFDVGHGAGSFWFRHAVPAIRQGFIPDSISTDLHTGNVNGVVIDMCTTMSKILNIGVPLERVIEMSTVAPAREMKRPELGTLSPGKAADIAVLALDEGEFTFVDCERTTMRGSQRLRCEMTLYGGEIVYNPHGHGLASWEQDLKDKPTRLPVRSQRF